MTYLPAHFDAKPKCAAGDRGFPIYMLTNCVTTFMHKFKGNKTRLGNRYPPTTSSKKNYTSFKPGSEMSAEIEMTFKTHTNDDSISVSEDTQDSAKEEDKTNNESSPKDAGLFDIKLLNDITDKMIRGSLKKIYMAGKRKNENSNFSSYIFNTNIFNTSGSKITSVDVGTEPTFNIYEESFNRLNTSLPCSRYYDVSSCLQEEEENLHIYIYMGDHCR